MALSVPTYFSEDNLERSAAWVLNNVITPWKEDAIARGCTKAIETSDLVATQILAWFQGDIDVTDEEIWNLLCAVCGRRNNYPELPHS
jgi:hypothetical protein